VKSFLPLLLILAGCKLSPQLSSPPTARMAATSFAAAADSTIVLLPVTRGANNPLGIPHLGLAAYWQNQPGGTWVAEYNVPEINGTNWVHIGNHWSGGQPFWNYTETSTNWMRNDLPLVISNQWQVRIRLLP
jgi:hypothetical protein